MTQADGTEYWQRSPKRKIKINTDVALFKDSNSYSYSMVSRDSKGELKEAAAVCKQGELDPGLPEAIGNREALSWVKQKDWAVVVVGSDCLAVVQAVRCSSINRSYLVRLVDECIALLVTLKERNVMLNFVKMFRKKGGSLYSEKL